MAGTIIVTGASGGIGRATAERFLEGGWRVGLVARREDRLADLADRYPGAALPLPGDVADEAAMEAAFARFVAETGRLDMLFNNAGIFGPAATPDAVPLDAFDAVMRTNVRGMFVAARAAFAQMRAQDPQGGRIVNNGSISAHVPRETAVCYTMSKHAVTGLTRSLSLDGRPFDIACGQIDIGNARTDLLDAQFARLRAVDPDAPAPPAIDVAHVAEALWNIGALPLSANVQFMTLMATKMPYIGRG